MTIEQVTAAAIIATDSILADIKKRGRGMQFLNKAQQEDLRQDWITAVTKAILKERPDCS